MYLCEFFIYLAFMKCRILIFFILLSIVSCKKDELSPQALLTRKNWKPVYTVSSSFKSCEVNDVYNFENSLLTVTRGQGVCQYRAFDFGVNPISYTANFTDNTIDILGMKYYITKLTSDTLKVYGKIPYLSGTITIPYVFVH